MAPRSPMSAVLLSLTQRVAGSTSRRSTSYMPPGRTNAGCGGYYDIVLALAGQTISAGDSVTVLLAGVTNPAAQTVSDFVVATSKDQLTATAAPYAITVSEAAGISVTASPATVGSLSTYTISNIVVGSAGVLAGATINFDRYDDQPGHRHRLPEQRS